jgi:pimeloyl-ACP methyl ester carboxylesterase
MKTKFAFKSQKGKSEILKIYDSLLEHWCSPNEKFYVDTRYGNTFIIASGKKENPPLILLHGSAMNSIMWLGDAQEYSRNHRVYAVDIPGEPGKSDEHQLPFNGPSFAEWLNDVYNALSIERASLIDISLGAWLSVKFSIRYPEKVDKLVLLSPAGIGRQKVSFLITATAYRLLGEKVVNRLFRRVNGNQNIPDIILKYQKLIGENFNYRREIIPLYYDSELKRLVMPTILFVGEKDVMFHSAETAKRLENLLPHANINIIPGAGHALIKLTSKIIEFIEFEQ